MHEIAGASNAIWATSVIAECFLVAILCLRKNYREYPFLLSYICASLLQSCALFVSYRVWGYKSFLAWEIAWATQAVQMIARALAVAEICYRLFEDYRGVWELIRRVLLGSAAIVLLYSVYVARHNWVLIMPNIQRALDLAIATVLVGLFLFARYYMVPFPAALKALALGFLLFSSFAVLNATVLERYMEKYEMAWTVLQMVAFLASVVIWTSALYQPHVAAQRASTLASSDVYRTLAPEVNRKLRVLNERLSRFWKVEANRS
jgi:hypothetical protein